MNDQTQKWATLDSDDPIRKKQRKVKAVKVFESALGIFGIFLSALGSLTVKSILMVLYQS